MIESGEKPEEYREIKPYWIKRLVNPRMLIDAKLPESEWPQHIETIWPDHFKFIRNRFDIVEAKNGYSKSSPKWRRKFIEVNIDYGKPEWGAEPGKLYFVIKLGEKIN